MKKIDINTHPKESIKIPSLVTYKNWEIRIKKLPSKYLLAGHPKDVSNEDKMAEGLLQIYEGNNLRGHLADFKKKLDNLKR